MTNILNRFTQAIATLRLAVATYVVARVRAPGVVWLGTQAFVPIVAPPAHPPLPSETWLLLHARLGRLANRFTALFARWRSGTLPSPRQPHASPAGARRQRERRPYTRLPSRRGWISAHIDTAPGPGLLCIVLAEPDLARFHAEAPQSGRLLRSLCHALGVELPIWLRLPPRPARPRRPPARQAASRPSAPGTPPATPDRPLPAYVRAAARAWKKSER